MELKKWKIKKKSRNRWLWEI